MHPCRGCNVIAESSTKAVPEPHERKQPCIRSIAARMYRRSSRQIILLPIQTHVPVKGAHNSNVTMLRLFDRLKCKEYA